MSKCAYCGTDGKNTREHVIPDSLDKRSPGRETFRASNESFFPAAQTVKDVCGPCNNVALSRLDAAFVAATNLHHGQWVRDKLEPARLELEGASLLRWLLKVAYNSARASEGASDIEALRACRKYVLGASRVPSGLFVYAGLVRSYRVLPGEREMAPGLDWIDPKQYRVGHYRDPALKPASIRRSLFFDQFGFLLVKLPAVNRWAINSHIESKTGYRRLGLGDAQHEIQVSKFDVLDANAAMFERYARAHFDHLPQEKREEILSRLARASRSLDDPTAQVPAPSTR